MAIVRIEPFDINIASPLNFATGGFWANLPRVCRGPASAKLLMISDTLRPEDVLTGFERVAIPASEASSGVRAYRTQYEDFLRGVAREIRYIRLYLALDTHLGDEGLVQLLATHGIGAMVVDETVPQPFAQGDDAWNSVVAPDGTCWAMLRSRVQQPGSVYPRSLHRLFGLDFPVWAVLNIHTFSTREALQTMRLKDVAARYDMAQGEAGQEARDVQSALAAIRHEMHRYGAALHTVRLYVLVGALTQEELSKRLEVARGAVPLDMEPAQAGEMPRVFSAEAMVSTEGVTVTTPGVAILAGSALSYRRRTETGGVLLGTDQHQGLVITNVFDDRNPSYNMVVLGQTGAGKTFGVLTLMLRHMLLGVKLIIVDPQGNIDLGFLKDYHKSILGTAEAAINVMDITRDTLSDQVTTVRHILNMIGVTNEGDPLETAILDEVLMDMYEPLWGKALAPQQVPTLAACKRRIEDMAGRAQIPVVRELAAEMAYQLRPYTEGSLAELFGRQTTVDFSLDELVTVFDVSRLPDQTVGGNLRTALLAILVSSVHHSIRRRRRAGDTIPMLMFIDEMGILMRDHVIASYVSAEYKTARARRVGMIVADQDLHSLLGPKDEHGIHHGIPILANAASTLIFRQKGSELPNVREHFPDIPGSLVDKLPAMRRGTCIAQFPDDLLVVNVVPSLLDRVILSSRLEDRAQAREIIRQLSQELGMAA